MQSEEKKDGKQLYEDEIDINAQLKIREKEEEKKRMDEEKLDKLRADQNKVLNDNFDLQFKQMLSVFIILYKTLF